MQAVSKKDGVPDFLLAEAARLGVPVLWVSRLHAHHPSVAYTNFLSYDPHKAEIHLVEGEVPRWMRPLSVAHELGHAALAKAGCPFHVGSGGRMLGWSSEDCRQKRLAREAAAWRWALARLRAHGFPVGEAWVRATVKRSYGSYVKWA